MAPFTAPMTHVFTNAMNLQEECPLFNRIPKEIRDNIFDLVLTPHDKKCIPYPEELQYSRPGFRNLDRNLSTTLLPCCQAIYLETYDLPAKMYVQVDWTTYYEGSVHRFNDANRSKRFPTAPRNLHLFTIKYFLDYWPACWTLYTRFIAGQAPHLNHLKITLGHDNSPEYADGLLVPDAMQGGGLTLLRRRREGDLGCMKQSYPADDQYKIPWGYRLEAFINLKGMELEVESLVWKLDKLDLVVDTAAEWRFPLANGQELVLNPKKTKWEGWHGPNLGKKFRQSITYGSDGYPIVVYRPTPIPGTQNEPAKSRQRLIEAGVDFMTMDDDPKYTSDDCETYCAVTLVFEATQSAETEQKASHSNE